MAVSKINAERTLLWENSVTSGGIGEVVLINEDISQYKYIEVWYNSRNRLNEGFKIFYSEIPNSSTEDGIIIAESSRNVIVERSFYLSNNKFRTGSGYYYNAFGGSAINNNAFIVPYRVYGLK